MCLLRDFLHPVHTQHACSCLCFSPAGKGVAACQIDLSSSLEKLFVGAEIHVCWQSFLFTVEKTILKPGLISFHEHKMSVSIQNKLFTHFLWDTWNIHL